MSASTRVGESVQGKRSYQHVPSTPGRTNSSPSRKLPRKPKDEQHPEIADTIRSILDEKMDQLTTRLSAMMDDKIAELEKKFKGIEKQISSIKEEFNETVNHMEDVLKEDIDLTWEYAVRNEQYSRKNNIRILGLDEDLEENLEAKFISCMKENLDEEIKPEEIEIIHRIGAITRSRAPDREDSRSTQPPKPRPVIVKLLSNKTKMRLLVKRRQLKGKKLVILEDMAHDLAKRLKKLKERRSVETAWFTNGKIKYKLKDDARVMELKGWMDLQNIE